jgi:type 1 glutamine amidotransferase
MKIRLSLGSVTLLMALLSLLPVAGAPPKPPHIVFVTGDHEYSSEETMPILAAELERHYGMQTTVLKALPDENAEENIPGLEALAKADVAVFFLRWRRLPAEQVEHIRKYLEAGKPVVAFRTTTHAFNYPKGHALEKWNSFAAEFLGAPPGWGNGHTHYGHKSSTDVSVVPAMAGEAILAGVDKSFHVRSWLYHVLPNYPPADAKQLLIGKAVGAERKDAIEHPVAWTWKNKAGGKVFVTTLGHPEDFQVEAVQRLAVNAVHWAAGKPAPKKWAGTFNVDVKYHGIRNTK